MSLTKEQVTKIAKLAHIEVTDADKEFFAHEISGLLKWVEQLQEVNTDGVAQMTSVAAMTLPRRKDEVTDGHCRDKVIANAPQAEYGCFTVPKVIE